MKILLQIHCSPETLSAQRAVEMVVAIHESRHDLAAVFFYFEGVAHGHDSTIPGRNDIWRRLAAEGIPLVLCQTAWQQRFTSLPDAAFKLGSLTDLVLWLDKADRTVCFGRALS